MTEKEELKATIVKANKAYRTGTAIMSDYEFDTLVEKYALLCNNSEFSEFQNSLHEVAGKVKHPYVLGSLNKLKASEPELVKKFISKNVTHALNVSAKVDGLSCRLHYENGVLISASTRGNGEFGESISAKMACIKHIPQTIPLVGNVDVRGELVIFKDDFLHFKAEFANPRNAVAGLINRKEWDEDDISKVSFVAYTILGPDYPKTEQFKMLKGCGFFTAWHKDLPLAECMNDSVISLLTALTQQNFDYENDGLVISDSEYINEDQYRPDAQVAFKINLLTATTAILDVVFDGPSKNGIHCPVAVLDPVELGGAMISRVTLHNLDYISEMDLRYGSKVEILRSGDVIPRIIRVVSNTGDTGKIELPLVCNCCGQPLVQDGVHLRCVNHKCKDQLMHQLASFIVKLGVKGATEKTLENLGILSYEDLLTFKPNGAYKTQTKLYDELLTKVFTRSKIQLLSALNIQDIGETLILKIISHYGLSKIESCDYSGPLPDGIGEITLEKFKSAISENLKIADMFIQDSRHSCTSMSYEVIQKTSNGQSICFTGKLNTMGRTEAEAKAKNFGFEIKGVSKSLTYLVTNDPDTNSGKGKKARELGIKIISEKEFLRMISSTDTSSELLSL